MNPNTPTNTIMPARNGFFSVNPPNQFPGKAIDGFISPSPLLAINETPIP
jgi:hypothetical protein